MSQTAELERSSSDQSEYHLYKRISPAALASMLLGTLAFLSYTDYVMAVIPVGGVILGLLGLLVIRKNPNELTGKVYAWAGIALSLVLGISGVCYQAYTYFTEVPAGYTRISFSQLQPDSKEAPFPKFAETMNGENVFIKGFVLPGMDSSISGTFILVPDNRDCCFGTNNPKITDMIAVRLLHDRAMPYEQKQYSVTGKFLLRPRVVEKRNNSAEVLYQMEATDLK